MSTLTSSRPLIVPPVPEPPREELPVLPVAIVTTQPDHAPSFRVTPR